MVTRLFAAKGLFWLLTAVWMFWFLSALAEPAQAYVDPGSGLLLYQAGGSIVTGLLFLLRQQIRRLFRRMRRPVEKQDGVR
jgi:hypothetical protein